jgi:hypothetical protein
MFTELDPPRGWAGRGIDGPVRGIIRGTTEPIGGGERSRVTIALDFEGRGIGKLLIPLVVRRQARTEMPKNLQRLKQRLESGGWVSLSDSVGGLLADLEAWLPH